ncbi:MAG: hypothetical protein KC431_31040 [Myxococcales bacterium]|nr:hypothetical protein [Myxococcales bacterium]MCA9701999.1 hypothetical protein [Myxococcales bacterium]
MPDVVNPQIVSSIKTTAGFVLEPSVPVAMEIVKAQVTQSLGLAVTDATEYMRNINAISVAAAGVAFRQLLSPDGDTAKATAALVAANKAVSDATKNLSEVGSAVTTVLGGWAG